MNKLFTIAALFASTIAAPVMAQSTNLTINTGLTGTYVGAGYNQAFDGVSILSGSFDYGQIASAAGTPFLNFVAPFTQNGQTASQDFALGTGVTARYDGTDLIFSQAGSTLFSFRIGNLLETNGAPPTTATTTTNASSFLFNGATVNIAAGSTGTLSALAPAAVGAVPEPAAWAMMIVGMGVAGVALRRQRVATRVSFAG